jgi:hypothetical protein
MIKLLLLIVIIFILTTICVSSSITTKTKINSIFSNNKNDLNALKYQILQLGCSLDRGQSYNPTSGSYYEDRIEIAREKINNLINKTNNKSRKYTLEEMKGEWELVFTTVPHGIIIIILSNFSIYFININYYQIHMYQYCYILIYNYYHYYYYYYKEYFEVHHFF